MCVCVCVYYLSFLMCLLQQCNSEHHAWSCLYAKFHFRQNSEPHAWSCLYAKFRLEQNTEPHARSCLYAKFHLKQNSEPRARSCLYANFRLNKTPSLMHDAVFMPTFASTKQWASRVKLPCVKLPSFTWKKHWASCMKLSLCQVSLEQNTEPHAWSCRYAKFRLNKTLSLMHEAVFIMSFA